MAEQEVNRYSDEELEEFRVLIEAKIAEAKKGLEMYLDAYSNAGNDTMDTSPTLSPFPH